MTNAAYRIKNCNLIYKFEKLAKIGVVGHTE